MVVLPRAGTKPFPKQDRAGHHPGERSSRPIVRRCRSARTRGVLGATLNRTETLTYDTEATRSFISFRAGIGER